MDDAIIEAVTQTFKPQRYCYGLAFRENQPYEVDWIDQMARKHTERFEGNLEIRVLIRGTISNAKTVSWHAREFSFRYPDRNLDISACQLDYCYAGIKDSYSKIWFRKPTGTMCGTCGHRHDPLQHALTQLDEIAEKGEVLAQSLGGAALALELFFGLQGDAETCQLLQETTKSIAGRMRMMHDNLLARHKPSN